MEAEALPLVIEIGGAIDPIFGIGGLLLHIGWPKEGFRIWKCGSVDGMEFAWLKD